MLRWTPSLVGSIPRCLVMAASVGLIAACAPESEDPFGPETQLASRDVTLEPQLSPSASTNIRFGDFALHLPANVNHVRGVLLALGGPDTRGFALGTPFGAPPAVEESLQQLGAMFRNLAAERGLAILGSGRFGPISYPNAPASDQLLLDAIAQAAVLAGRPELVDAPILVYGISGGAPEATGFTQRNPERVGALFLKVPQSAGPLTGQALHVPAFMVLAEFDAFVDNAMLTATFQAHRAAGAPWAMAVEPAVPHHLLSTAQRALTIDWMRAILPLGSADPFHQNPPLVGWLGDPTSGAVSPFATFEGNRATASWLPTRTLALQWAAFSGL